MPSKFLNADDTVDLIKSGVGALDDKILYSPNCLDLTSDSPKAIFAITTQQNNQDVILHFYTTKNNTTVTIDWGDNTEPTVNTYSSSYTNYQVTHRYSKPNNYSITITDDKGYANNPALVLGISNQSYPYSTPSITPIEILTEVNINNISLGTVCFRGAKNLKLAFLKGNNIHPFTDYVWYDCTSLLKIICYNTTGREALGLYSMYGLNCDFNYPNIGSIQTNAFGYYNKEILSLNTSNSNTVNLYGANIFAYSNIKKLYIYNCANIGANGSSNAFQNADKLEEIHFSNSTPPTVSGDMKIPSTCIIYVPQGSLNTYKTASGWSTYANQIFEEPIEQYRAIENKIDEAITDVTTLPTGSNIKDMVYRLATTPITTNTLTIVGTQTDDVASCVALGMTSAAGGSGTIACTPASPTTIELNSVDTPCVKLVFGEYGDVYVYTTAEDFESISTGTYTLKTAGTTTYTYYMGDSTNQATTQIVTVNDLNSLNATTTQY